MDVSAGFDVAELPTAIARWSSAGVTRRWWPPAGKGAVGPHGHGRAGQADAVLLGGGQRRGRCSRVRRPPGSGWCVQLQRDLRRLRVDGVPWTASGPDGRLAPSRVRAASSSAGPPWPKLSEPARSGSVCRAGLVSHRRPGHRRRAGRLIVLGRIDEAISTGGLTVMPAPVEAVLARHPAVADCGLRARRRSPRRLVVAAVILTPGSAEPTLGTSRLIWRNRWMPPRRRGTASSMSCPERGIGKIDRRALSSALLRRRRPSGGYGS